MSCYQFPPSVEPVPPPEGFFFPWFTDGHLGSILALGSNLYSHTFHLAHVFGSEMSIDCVCLPDGPVGPVAGPLKSRFVWNVTSRRWRLPFHGLPNEWNSTTWIELPIRLNLSSGDESNWKNLRAGPNQKPAPLVWRWPVRGHCVSAHVLDARGFSLFYL